MRSFSFCGIFFILNLPSSTWSNQFEAKESNLQYSLPSRFPKKEEAEILNFYENFLFSEVFSVLSKKKRGIVKSRQMNFTKEAKFALDKCEWTDRVLSQSPQ